MNRDKFKSNIDKMIGLSLRKKGKLNVYVGKRLIVWAEAAINAPTNEEHQVLKYISRAINDKYAIVIAGIDRYNEEHRLHNSAYAFDASGKILQIYDKRHLLPFGEYIPKFLAQIGLKKLTQGIINFSRGKLTRTMRLDGVEPFELLICYEIAFPGKISDSKDSKWILNITNDAWFENSDGPTQHCKMAFFRAIEERKPIARCANNGISCLIDCCGQITEFLCTNSTGVLIANVP